MKKLLISPTRSGAAQEKKEREERSRLGERDRLGERSSREGTIVGGGREGGRELADRKCLIGGTK